MCYVTSAMASKSKDQEYLSENASKERVLEKGTRDVNFREGIPLSDEHKTKTEKTSDKSFKTPQRSMRRGSGTGSPNSLSSIPRYPAFDFSEQDEEQSFAPSASTPKPDKSVNPQALQISDSRDCDYSLPSPSSVVKDVRHKKSDPGKSMTLMPDLMENSETESAKGSFECEAPEMPVTEVPTIAVSEVSFPSLPDSFLQKLGVHKESSSVPETFSEQELEAKYNTLSLAFKTDKLTLSKRLELQKRQRDNAEKNVENEIKVLRDSLSSLNLNCTSSEARDLISKIQNHIDIIQQATSRMSGRSEIYGAVQQEERVSRAFEVLVLHVDNLKRILDKERRELEEARRILSGTREVGAGEASGDDSKRSLRAVSLAVGSLRSQTARRRASVAVLRSSPDGLKPRSMSSSWTAGFHNFKDTRSSQPSVLHPFSLTSSIGLSSNSSSASLLAPLPSPSCRANPVMRRRGSLPTDAGENCDGFNVPNTLELLREKSVLKGVTQDQDQGELCLNISRKLYSVSDEEEEEQQEDLCCEERNENLLNGVLEPSQAILPSSDPLPDHDEREHSAQEKYGPQRKFYYRSETSGLLLLRYSFSGLLVIMAFLCLLITFLPCLALFGDSQSFQEVLETVFQHYVVVKHLDRPV